MFLETQKGHRSRQRLLRILQRFDCASQRITLEGHAQANRQKPSGIAAKERILRVHIVPLLGSKKVDAVTTEDVQRLKICLKDKAPKTVNNVLTVFNVLLKKAVEWDVIERMPCTIRLLHVTPKTVPFHDFDRPLDAELAFRAAVRGNGGVGVDDGHR